MGVQDVSFLLNLVSTTFLRYCGRSEGVGTTMSITVFGGKLHNASLCVSRI